MKTSAILLTILLLTAATAARAQDNTPITNTGARNLMFSFGGLSTMTAGPYLATKAGGTGDSAGLIPTYGIGYRYFLNNNLALRATLGFAMNNNDTKGTNGNSDATTDATAFGIGAGVEWHMAPVAAVSPYAGAELGFLTGFDSPQVYQKVPNTMRVGGGVDPSLGDFYTMNQEFKGCLVMGGTQIDGRSSAWSTGQNV